MTRHQRSTKLLLTAAVAALVLTCTNESRAADFRGLGFLHPEDNSSNVTGMSPDGTAVVGGSRFLGEPGANGSPVIGVGTAAFLWTPASGLREIRSPAFPGEWIFANGVSNSAEVVVGHPTPVPNPAQPPPFRWTAPDGLQPFPGSQRVTTPDYAGFSHVPNSVSGDGVVYVGATGLTANAPRQAFRYTDAGGYSYLGLLPGVEHIPIGDLYNSPVSTASAISTDGQAIVGFSSSGRSWGQPAIPPLDAPYNGTEAFLWSQEKGMVGLGDLPGGFFSSQASAVSADHRTVVGMSSIERGNEAFRWSEATGMVGLGYLFNDFKFSHATGVSADGSTVVGSTVVDAVIQTGDPNYADEVKYSAFIWDTEHGMRDLKSVLESEHGLNLAGWQLTSAIDISDDGLVIAGNGINPLGREEGWVVRLEAIPEPATSVLFILGACGIGIARNRLLGRSVRQSAGTC
jgi:probable HAF family extracellular repeat protein